VYGLETLSWACKSILCKEAVAVPIDSDYHAIAERAFETMLALACLDREYFHSTAERRFESLLDNCPELTEYSRTLAENLAAHRDDDAYIRDWFLARSKSPRDHITLNERKRLWNLVDWLMAPPYERSAFVPDYR
jgi:hypothetical protein